ncbi:hypothetical protein PoB_003836900 [Plakobranchus ocellatus]|uniref:Uncharacterized protein n=1 Tax=Plakobranchus ocellatus TaxID=259542 RepID=A0AAV4B0G4_9GAST|nr:hypothetical protein PoB_003836900 [Plakobranchus ocellatus]
MRVGTGNHTSSHRSQHDERSRMCKEQGCHSQRRTLGKSPAGHRGDQNRSSKGYRREHSHSPVHQRGDRGHRGDKSQSLGVHIIRVTATRVQPSTEETGASDVVIMGATGDVSMTRRFTEVDQLVLQSPKRGQLQMLGPAYRQLYGDGSRAVIDSRIVHRYGFNRIRKWQTSWNPGVHECEYPGPALGLMGANAMAGYLGVITMHRCDIHTPSLPQLGTASLVRGRVWRMVNGLPLESALEGMTHSGSAVMSSDSFILTEMFTALARVMIHRRSKLLILLRALPVAEIANSVLPAP